MEAQLAPHPGTGGPDEELRGGGWSRRLVTTVAVVAAAVVAALVVVLVQHTDHPMSDEADGMREVTAAFELVNGANRALTVRYPISVTGPGMGTRIHVQVAIVGTDQGGANQPPRRLARIPAGARAELWLVLRLDCRGHAVPRPSTRSLTISVRLTGVSRPATFTFASLFDVVGQDQYPAC
jgi:hypothetical protein